ncbi:MAG: lactonase family protein [Anaerolineae bacterium]|nr:lactonase family protein [Anaerolineae bacterium]
MADNILVFVGTYTTRVPHTRSISDGLYAYRLDMSSGALSFASKYSGIDNPSYLAVDPGQRYLYAVSEVANSEGRSGGALNAFRIHPEDGALTLLNGQSSHGVGPCHVWVDHSGEWVMVANYGSGSAAVYPVNADGSLAEASDTVQHSGSGVNPQRQEGPHAHCIMTDPTGDYVLISDLGLDKVMVYHFDRHTGKLTAGTPGQVTPGQGPRHLDFHPSGRYCFLINEMGCTITVFAYEAGKLREVQNISTVPDGFVDENTTTAAIHVSPDGRFVYGSNRGHDSIAMFAFDTAAGQLTALGHVSTQGNTPRDFMIDPTGTFLLAANQDSNTIVTFRIDSASGRLTPTGHVAQVPTAVCLKAFRS